MRRQSFRRAHLIGPRETTGAVRRELYIIRRIGIHKIITLQLECFDIFITEFPLAEYARVTRKIFRVVDCVIRSEGHVEIAALIETAETIETRAVQVVEQLRTFRGVCFAFSNQRVESLTMTIKERFVVSHLHPHSQTVLHLAVEIYQMRVDVVQQCMFWLQAKSYREAAAEWFHIPSLFVCFPPCVEMRHQPAFAAGPFQRRF